jgi:hypothetical protein
MLLISPIFNMMANILILSPFFLLIISPIAVILIFSFLILLLLFVINSILVNLLKRNSYLEPMGLNFVLICLTLAS